MTHTLALFNDIYVWEIPAWQEWSQPVLWLKHLQNCLVLCCEHHEHFKQCSKKWRTLHHNSWVCLPQMTVVSNFWVKLNFIHNEQSPHTCRTACNGSIIRKDKENNLSYIKAQNAFKNISMLYYPWLFPDLTVCIVLPSLFYIVKTISKQFRLSNIICPIVKFSGWSLLFIFAAKNHWRRCKHILGQNETQKYKQSKYRPRKYRNILLWGMGVDSN